MTLKFNFTFKSKYDFIFFNNRGNSMIDQLQDYFLWGCAVTEVELDLLTGEKKVNDNESA
jgi:hypothetical protein